MKIIKCSAFDFYENREIDLTSLKSVNNYEAQIDEQLKSKEPKDIKVSENCIWFFQFPYFHRIFSPFFFLSNSINAFN